MNLGDFNSSVAYPVAGSDGTTGYSPATMHADPYAPPAPVVIVAPQSSGFPWMWLLVLAGVAWYGYKQGWFDGLLESEPETTMVIERRKAA